jgi:hypothetical protein
MGNIAAAASMPHTASNRVPRRSRTLVTRTAFPEFEFSRSANAVDLPAP